MAIVRYELQVFCVAVNMCPDLDGFFRRTLEDELLNLQRPEKAAQYFSIKGGYPALMLCYLEQVVVQSSWHEHNTVVSVISLQPQKESH